MKITSTLDNNTLSENALYVAFYFEDKKTNSVERLKNAGGDLIDSLVLSQPTSANLGNATPLLGHSHLPSQKTLVLGCGSSSSFNEKALIKTIQAIFAQRKTLNATDIVFNIDEIIPAGRSTQWAAQKASETLYLSSYQYDTTLTKKADDLSETELTLISSENIESALQQGESVAYGMNVARELGNLPANICDPDYLADHARALGEAHDNIEVDVLEEADLTALGMGAFMAVSQGSDKAGKILVIKYNGGQTDEAPHVLVGKGLTFDSGGISIKPAGGMEEMKWDMQGAASVLGTMNTIAKIKPAMNIIGVVATAENMVSGGATRPGDVVTCMNGKTVEIINTDAEGRLVLCDTLTYVERFKPASVVDVATLTGAVIVALGHHATAVYANDETLQTELLEAGTQSWDRGWPMPLWDEFKEDLKSPYADLRNVGSRAGGSVTAAIYLSYFAENYRWAHLDIAGTAWMSAKTGATGRPVGLLTQYLLNQAS